MIFSILRARELPRAAADRRRDGRRRGRILSTEAKALPGIGRLGTPFASMLTAIRASASLPRQPDAGSLDGLIPCLPTRRELDCCNWESRPLRMGSSTRNSPLLPSPEMRCGERGCVIAGPKARGFERYEKCLTWRTRPSSLMCSPARIERLSARYTAQAAFLTQVHPCLSSSHCVHLCQSQSQARK
jgi:hypothetical protein